MKPVILLAHIRYVEADFWAKAKPRTVQFIMGTASFLYAYMLAQENDTFNHFPSFAMMAALLPVGGWIALFVAHGLLVLVCRWAPVYLWRTQLAANLLGFVIWTFYVVSGWYSLGKGQIGTSLEVVMIGMMGWLIYRTERGPAPAQVEQPEYADATDHAHGL